jgi:hypothetical protein
MNNEESNLLIEMYSYLSRDDGKLMVYRQVYDTTDHLSYDVRVTTQKLEISNLSEWPDIQTYAGGTRVDGIYLKDANKYFIKAIFNDNKNYKV